MVMAIVCKVMVVMSDYYLLLQYFASTNTFGFSYSMGREKKHYLYKGIHSMNCLEYCIEASGVFYWSTTFFIFSQPLLTSWIQKINKEIYLLLYTMYTYIFYAPWTWAKIDSSRQKELKNLYQTKLDFIKLSDNHCLPFQNEC